MTLVFLTEEPSMKEVLEAILPQVLPNTVRTLVIPHNGKSDLHDSIERKLRAWKGPDTRFVILHDKDSNDCLKLKADLRELAATAGRPDTLIRIVCTELESWFLGDLAAVKKAFPLRHAVRQEQRKYRDPDKISNAKQELRKIAPAYQPILGSKEVAKHMDLQNNQSHSFQVFLTGLRHMIREERAFGGN